MDDDSKTMLVNELSALSRVLLARSELLSKMGKSFGTQRDLYQALGYITNPTFTDYWWRYKRTAFGRRIIRAYPVACWKRPPQVQETQDTTETAFEKEWAAFVSRTNLFLTLRRLDILAGIGTYGVLYLGFSGAPETPLKASERFLYMRPFTSNVATVERYVDDAKDERYGLPELYKVQLNNNNSKHTIDTMVHHSRIIHVAEDPTDDEAEGIPRLEAPLNDLQSLDYVAGGSGEMFWRGALPGHAFVAREGVQFPATGTTAATGLDDQITSFLHNLKRYLKLEGVDVQSLAPNVSSPKDHFDVLVSCLSAATGIPKRILLGSERGELASTEDRDNWGDLVADRQRNFCEPKILRPLIDKLVEFKVLSVPANPYIVSWPPLQAPSGEQMATTAKAVAEAANTYASGPADTVIPKNTFLQRYLGFSPEEVADMEPVLDEAEQIDEEEKLHREEVQRERFAAKPPVEE
ncbi:MAG: DUF1073 domain-containing protein [Dehalococcoidales bacterium]|jgi:hypothetical protein|nr:DUF1073 domain-containing protein [Dehalococcoidales bacterium]